MKPRQYFVSALLLAVCVAIGSAQDPAIAALSARHSPEWLKSGVICQIFVRRFCRSTDLNGVTVRLEDVHALGVKILGLMPIHLYGQVKKKWSLPIAKAEGSAIPFMSLNPIGAGILERQGRQDQP
jgi:hypothetical protein